MLTIRKADERGHFDFGWLDTFHTFSFGEYYDPNHMSFRSLRVINEDQVAPGKGFGTHPHRDMEIITYVISGALQHRDSMGNGSVIRPGEVQRMTAGTGVSHSEFNGSQTEPVHLLQIWILPEKIGLTPGYEQKMFSDDEKLGKLRLIASRDGREGSVKFHQDANIHAALLQTDQKVEMAMPKGRGAWVQLIEGEILVNGDKLLPGDGAAITDEPKLEIKSVQDSHFLIFDLN